MRQQTKDKQLTSQKSVGSKKQPKPDLPMEKMRKELIELQDRVSLLQKRLSQDHSNEKIKEWYKFPAQVARAEKHKKTYMIADQRRTFQKCPCCQQFQCKEPYSLILPACSFIDAEKSKSDPKVARMALYFTLLKGLILYLILRFLFYDFVSLRLSVSGSFCSDLFKNHTGKCTYTFSVYNLKGQSTEGLYLDEINAIFTFLSILYFVILKSFIEKNKRQFEKGLIEEDQFSVLVSNVPSYIISNLEKIYDHEGQTRKLLLSKKHSLQSQYYSQQNPGPKNYFDQLIQEQFKKIQLQRVQQLKQDTFQIKNTQSDCKILITELFVNRIRQLVNEQRYKMIDQYYYLIENTTDKLFSQISAEQQIKIKLMMTQEKDLLKEMDITIIPEVNFCYDLAEINRINHLRSQTSFKNQQESQDWQYRKKFITLTTQSKLIEKAASSFNEIEIFLQEKFKNHNQIGFHAAHFSGKLLVSFQYKFFRDLILDDYEKYPENFQINGNNINIQVAAKPTDINWQNINEDKQSKSTYTLHSWIVMVMILILSFAAFTDLKLIQRSLEVTTQETPWQVFKRNSFSLFSALVATLINKGLGNAIQILVKMEKHSTKVTRQNSYIIKNVLAQSINSLFIYIIIYIINPSNPLGPYGLAEKAISLAVVSNLTTIFFQVVRPENLWQNIKKFDYGNKSKVKQVRKFQIQLNKEYQYPKFDQQGMYVFYTLMIFLVSFYGFLVPVITPIVFGFFIVLYWVDKYNAFKRSSLDSFDDNRGDRILTTIQLSVLLSAISYFIWDLNIQKEPKFKLLNLISILFALQFTGYQAFVSIEIRNKIVQNEEQQGKLRVSYGEINFKTSYKSQNLATKHCITQEKEKINVQRNLNQLYTLVHQEPYNLIKKVNKFSQFQFRKLTQVDQKTKNQECIVCKKKMINGKVYNIFCGHEICTLCFWNNIYHKIESFSQITCLYCQKTIDETLYMPELEERLKLKADQINSRLKKGSKSHLCSQTLSACEENKGQCSHRYCKHCLFQKHQNIGCEAAFTQRAQWLTCPNCSLIIQPTNKCYNHFGRQLLQTKCPICILGWSDAYNHKCRNQKAEPNCWFINILTGILYVFLLILAATALVVSFVAFYAVCFALFFAIFPIFVSISIIILIFKCEWEFVVKLTILLPISMFEILVDMSWQLKRSFSRNCLMIPLIDWVSQFPSKIKNRFYEYQPYKQAVFDYAPMKLSSKRRRIAYSLLMLLLLPLLFGLATGFFVVSALVVFCFTLVLLPFLISTEKRISIWIPICFYPAMLIYYLAPIYFKFIYNQMKDLGYFYLNYIITMGKYMFCNCASDENKQANSLQGQQQDENFC